MKTKEKRKHNALRSSQPGVSGVTKPSWQALPLGTPPKPLYNISVLLDIAQLLTHLDPLVLLNRPVPAIAALVVRPASIE